MGGAASLPRLLSDVYKIKESLGYAFGTYERQVVRFYREHAPYDLSVDVGAGTGYHTRRLAKLSKRVIAIEPARELVKVPANVEIHKVAAGNGSNGTMLLDDIIGREAQVGFFKIDIEGAELEVLEPSSVLQRTKFAMIELHDNHDLAEYQRRIFGLLKDFRVFASELGSIVTLDNVPLPPWRMLLSGTSDNHRLLCTRRS